MSKQNDKLQDVNYVHLPKGDMESDIKNCLSSKEYPIKNKHIRSVIINCYQLRNGPLQFWKIITSKDFTDTKNHIVVWKICQLIHKVISKGPVLCIEFANQYWSIQCIHIGNIFQNLISYTDNYNICVVKYIKLLTTKIKFYIKYKSFIPPDLEIKNQNWLENYDIIKLLCLADDMFDYLDDIINVQKNVFDTKITHSTIANECRFMALSTLIEDTKILYFTLIPIMRTLHLNFTKEILLKHCQRFDSIFFYIKEFFDNSIKLNLFEKIIWIPKMSDTPPEFHTYITKNTLTNAELQMRLKAITNLNENDRQAPTNPHFNDHESEYYYDSDFSDSDDDDIDTCNNNNMNYENGINKPKLPNKPITYSRQITLTGSAPHHQSTVIEYPKTNSMLNDKIIASASAPSLEILLEDKEETINNLKRQLQLSEQQIAMKNYEINNLKNENSIKSRDLLELKNDYNKLENKYILFLKKMNDYSEEQHKSNLLQNSQTKINLLKSKKNDFRSQHDLNFNNNNNNSNNTKLNLAISTDNLTTNSDDTFKEWTNNRMRRHVISKDDNNYETLKIQLPNNKISSSYHNNQTNENKWTENDFLLYEFDQSFKDSTNSSFQNHSNKLYSDLNQNQNQNIVIKKPDFSLKPITKLNTLNKLQSNSQEVILRSNDVNTDIKLNDEEHRKSANFSSVKAFWNNHGLIGSNYNT